MLPAEYPCHRPPPSTLCPYPAWSCRLWVPPFGRHEAAIGKTLIPAEFLPVVELGQERPPQFEQDARLFPGFEPPPAGAGTAIPSRQLTPLGASPEDPKNAFKAAPILDAWAATPPGWL